MQQRIINKRAFVGRKTTKYKEPVIGFEPYKSNLILASFFFCFRVNLLRLEIAQYLEIAYFMSMEQVYVVKSLYRFDTAAFKVLLAELMF